VNNIDWGYGICYDDWYNLAKTIAQKYDLKEIEL